MENGEIIIYQPNDITRLEVMIKDETVWLSRLQMALLFDRDVKTIGKHINNALREELRDVATVANFAIVQKEGERYVSRNIDYYSLDMILSVGYRVKSEKGILFRRWANSVLKEYIINLLGYCYEVSDFSKIEKYIADDCKWYSFFSGYEYKSKKEIMNYYNKKSKLMKNTKMNYFLITVYYS